MFRALFSHDIKKSLRSPALTQNMVSTVLLGLLGIYLAFNLIILGLFVDNILVEIFPNQDLLTKVGGLLVYYFLGDIIVRVLLQKFPHQDVKPYLALPISKTRLTHFVVLKSVRSFFNLIPLLMILPFVISAMPDYYSLSTIISFLVLTVGWILFNNFLSYYLDRGFRVKPWLSGTAVFLLIVVFYLDYSGVIGLNHYLEQLFKWLTHTWPLPLLPWLAALIMYFLSFRITKNNYYLEDRVTSGDVRSFEIGWFHRFGNAGKLMDLEAKLIWRNKRSRSFLFISLLFMLYPLIFLGDDISNYMWLKIFIGLFMTGIFALNYGQLMLSWNSPHFDLLSSRQIEIKDIFKAKYYLLVLSCVICYVLSIPYGFLDSDYFLIFTSLFFFNIGGSIFMYMFLASYNSKRIDLGKGAMMNYEGISAAHFLIIIPIFFIPFGIYLIFNALGNSSLGIIMIGIVGLLGLIMHSYIIDTAVKSFQKNRYRIAAAFRKKS